jgi:hypothetical protein
MRGDILVSRNIYDRNMPRHTVSFDYSMANLTWQQFVGFIVTEFGDNTRVYGLRSFADYKNRTRINTIELLKVALVHQSPYRIVVSKEDVTPEKAPIADDISSISGGSAKSDGSRGSVHTVFSNIVRRIDKEKCVFCGSSTPMNRDVCLFAAHIVAVKTPDADQVCIDLMMSGVYDPRNGITLCKDCHTAMDAFHCCMDENFKVRVSDAVLAVKSLSNKWKSINGKQIVMVRPSHISPTAEVLQYGVRLFYEKKEERNKLAIESPSMCDRCRSRFKGEEGLVTHQLKSSKCGVVLGHSYY